MKLPGHGKITCSDCYNSGVASLESTKWKMRNDPGAWGAAEPEYLVLGFSKGATQSDIYASGAFDDVAFGGVQTRKNLSNILRTIGLLKESDNVDRHISISGTRFHFASLVRCSLARLNEKKLRQNGVKSYETSGKLIVKSFTEVPSVVSRCARKYLQDFPESLKAVLVLGTNDAYINKMKSLIQEIHPTTYKEFDGISYEAGGVLWLHITHPSKGNGHLSSWLYKDSSNASGKKRIQAIQRLNQYVYGISS
ncbi:hypothetical protein KUW19_07110 [Ferrimonas balearica]|uniref:hypothetical protein n=1 Tax=Ferrimonas balearica TaxID=44012 RepID=UPI001C9705E7|nr:hypothetical protein [Ferrimonas balearica]MBY6106260.1 hypothetical protein [Ferrimonas balearica]